MKWIFIGALSLFTACNQTQVGTWNGGKITTPGKYAYHDGSIVIEVLVENGLVRYYLYNGDHDLLVKYNYDISTYQNWAFYLDDRLNFWVLSSDIGHSVWKKNSTQYFHYEFQHLLRKEEVPEKLYSECKEFFYNE